MLTADPKHREATVDALAKMGKAQIDLIGKGLANSNAEVRRSAVEALGRIKHSHASDLLSKALEDQDASVRLSAVQALSYLGSRVAERKLVAMARTDPNTNVRRSAQKALRK
jgi:HEAT repeat protein